MSDILKQSIEELMEYARGNTEDVEIRTYKIEEVPDYNGQEIRDIREKIDFPRNVMADILGVSVRTIEKWEIDGAKPNGSARRLLQLIESDPLSILNNIENLTENA